MVFYCVERRFARWAQSIFRPALRERIAVQLTWFGRRDMTLARSEHRVAMLKRGAVLLGCGGVDL